MVDHGRSDNPCHAPVTASTATEVLDEKPPVSRARALSGWTTSATLDPRRNSLNLLRLVLAASVFVSHSFALSASGPEPRFAGETLGGWAVIGFFVISGYLITASRTRTDLGTYLVHRVARIFPAFLVCLVVTVVVFAPIAFVVERGGLDGYLTSPNTPFNYVFANAGLRIADFTVAGTLATVPYPLAWNGPLWTLYYEFVCYLVVGFVAIFPWVRTKPYALVALFLITVLVRINLDVLSGYTNGNGDVVFLSKLLPYFLGGAVVYMLRERIPLRWWVALPSLALGLVIVSTWNTWGGQLAAPLYAIAILWVASWLPSPVLIQRNDISYGVYIYAWPIQQLLALAGVHERGQWVYNLSTAALTAVAATASWLLVERPVMRRARQVGKKPSPPIEAAPSALPSETREPAPA